MKKIWILLALLLLLAGCSAAAPDTSTEETAPAGSEDTADTADTAPAPDDAAGKDRPPDNEQAPAGEQNGLPATDPRYRDYAERYMAAAQYTLLRYEFSDGEYSALTDWSTLAMIAEDFYIDTVGEEDWYFQYWDNGRDGFPQDFFEGLLQTHLRIPAEEIRAAFGDKYEDGLYFYEDGRGGPGYTAAVITGANRDGNILLLDYDLYIGFETFELRSSGQVTIEIDGDNFHYIANTVRLSEQT